MVRDTIYINEYTYEVELLNLIDLTGKNSIIHTDGFKIFLNKEISKKQKIKYDLDINVRDLYPISIHTEDKDEIDVKRFNKLNDIILNHSKRISRRVTKKEIVYKKDKSKSIVSFIITKHEGIKIFTFKKIEDLDNERRFYSISKSNCKPLERCYKIKTDEDLNYISLIMKDYLDDVL